jgi:GxxExxY protein
VYSACLRHELASSQLSFETKRKVEVRFQDTKLGHPAELDLVVADQVLVVALSVPAVLPVHEAHVRSQMRLGNLPVALLLNFHANRLVDDLKRFGSAK